MKVVYSHQARNDLHEIYEYIAQTLLAPENAESTVKRIMGAVRELGNMPESNPLYKDEPWRSQGVRFITVRNYMVFYVVNEKTQIVSIIRIMYRARDISNQLEETEF